MPRTVTTRGKTSDNINLDEDVVKLMIATYGGTRLGRQELDGELILDVEGALWSRELLARSRCAGAAAAGSTGSSSGSIRRSASARIAMRAGSSCAGRPAGGSTCSRMRRCSSLSPEGWSAVVAAAAARWNTALVVAEANQGGAMVESVLKAADDGLKVRLVHASRGKSARAEPVSLLFEKGRVSLCGEFGALEDQLAGMQAGGGYEGPGGRRTGRTRWSGRRKRSGA